LFSRTPITLRWPWKGPDRLFLTGSSLSYSAIIQDFLFESILSFTNDLIVFKLSVESAIKSYGKPLLICFTNDLIVFKLSVETVQLRATENPF
jgi:hypothetical protein